MNSGFEEQYIRELISGLLDGELSADQQRDLLEVIRDDKEVARMVTNLFLDSCILEVLHATKQPEHFVKRIILNAQYLETGESFTNRVASAAQKQDIINTQAPTEEQRVEQVRRYAELQLKAYLEEQEQLRKQQDSRQSPHFSLDLENTVRKVQSFLRTMKKAVVTATISAAFILFTFLAIQQILAHRVVATLGQTINAQGDQAPEQNELRPGWMKLEEGYASIQFKKGAEVILQAPSVFELKSPNRMFLESGWITAKVPEQARGFTVKTPASNVIDYGTEFGLLVGTGNSAEIHVFDGNIGLKSANNMGSQRQQAFKKGETATIDISGHVERNKLINRPNLFVRAMPESTSFGVPGKRLSLADIIGGGNGLNTGLIGQGLDPSTGEITKTRKLLKADSNEFNVVSSLMFVDGVFVPDANDGPVVITSTGLLFENCPATWGLCYESITNGAVFRAGSRELHEGRLKGQTYNAMLNPSISMHPNAGITFDLGKIRSSMPEVRIVRFSAICGVSDSVIEYFDRDWDPRDVKIDFWVLVDGRIRFSKKLAAASSMTELIDIPLNPDDRFLTLATTNPGDYLYCWGMFAEPMLELKTKTETTTKGITK